MSTTLNHYHMSTLPRNTIKNLKNDSHFLIVTTKNGNANIYPPMYVVDKERNDSTNIYDVPKATIEKFMTNGETSQKGIYVGKLMDNYTGKRKKFTPL